MTFRYDAEENVIYKDRGRQITFPEVLEFFDNNSDALLQKLGEDFVKREHTINKLLNPRMPYYFYFLPDE